MTTLFRKGIIEEMKDSNVSSHQVKRIRRALEIIQSMPAEELIRLNNLKKITVKDRDDICLYRVDMRQRIVLSIDKKNKIVHSIVDAENIKYKC